MGLINDHVGVGGADHMTVGGLINDHVGVGGADHMTVGGANQ